MFNKKDNFKSDTIDFDIVIGENSKLEGKIISEGSIRIDGTLNGDVDSKGNVIIGSNATVNGDISTNDIKISGIVNGNIVAKGLLKIYETGNLNGDLECSSFVIEEGGTFEGRCNIKGKKATLEDDSNITDEENVNSDKDDKKDKKDKKKKN